MQPYPKVGPLTHIGGTQHGNEVVSFGGPTIEFPDGNASITRLLVRAMIPDALPGQTMEDAITSHLNYSTLDRANQPVRVRLNSTAVKVKHVGEPDTAKEVEITYVRGGKAEKVHGAERDSGLLQRDDSVSLPGNEQDAEGGSGLLREEAAGLHERLY